MQGDDAARCFHVDAAFVGQLLFVHEFDEAARAIAALFDLAAIGIEDAIAEIHIGEFAGRPFHQQQLVAAYAEMAIGNQANLRCIERNFLGNGVNYNKIVADPMHFGEL